MEETIDIRAPLEIAQGDAESGQRICAALPQFWAMRGYIEEGRSWCAAVLALVGGAASTSARAKALNGAARMAALGGDVSAAQDYLEEGLAIERTRGNREGIAAHLNNLGNVAHSRGDYTSALASFEESLAIERAMGNRPGISRTLNNLGNVRLKRGDLAAAKACYTQSMTLLRELGERYSIAVSLGTFAGLAISGIETNTPPSASSDLKPPADAAPARAARLWSASQALCEQIGATRPPAEQERMDRNQASARQRLSDAEWEAAWAEGLAFSLEQAIDYALQC